MEKPNYKKGLSTGSTMLNLACTGRPSVGFLPGHFYFLVGDSQSGKTFLSLTCFAEAGINPHFEDYRLIFDNAEDGALMDVAKYFGRNVADRIEPPSFDSHDNPRYSTKIEELYFHLDDAINEGKPFIYVLDSMDALGSLPEEKKFDQHKKSHRKKLKKEENPDAEVKEEKVAGSFGDGKAKINSSYLRTVISNLSKTGSILIVINQTRDNVGTFVFEKKTRSGGHALTFYATLEIWSSIAEQIKKKVREKDRIIGIRCKARVKKNRSTGRDRTVKIPIYYSHGFDDTQSMVDFLLEEQHWKAVKAVINASEFSFRGKKDDLIVHIEENNKEKELKLLVSQVWQDIEDGCTVKRKKRYE